jgi:hydrogenase expression/formation protein HypE
LISPDHATCPEYLAEVRDPGVTLTTLIGEMTAEPEEMIVLKTAIGGSRVLDMLVGDPLPRIC